jgi:environmental stress-induced protein Ves
MQILRAAQHRTMPWKNGGGSTTEIAVAPDGAGLDGFDWRISMAVVAADGPFSAFPGVDRTLAVLQGNGLVLHGLPGGPVRLARGAAPFAFPADAAVSATLPDGAITDLNVMTRRRRFRSRVRRTAGSATLDAGTAVAFVLAEAPCRVAVDDAEAVALDRHDALRLDRTAGRHVTVGDGGAWLIELLPDQAVRSRSKR